MTTKLIRTIDGKDVFKVFKMYREQHIPKVIREKNTFSKWYDMAGIMVLDGATKIETIDKLAPWGCDLTQSNGVVAGANQAVRLLKYLDK